MLKKGHIKTNSRHTEYARVDYGGNSNSNSNKNNSKWNQSQTFNGIVKTFYCTKHFPAIEKWEKAVTNWIFNRIKCFCPTWRWNFNYSTIYLETCANGLTDENSKHHQHIGLNDLGVWWIPESIVHETHSQLNESVLKIDAFFRSFSNRNS